MTSMVLMLQALGLGAQSAPSDPSDPSDPETVAGERLSSDLISVRHGEQEPVLFTPAVEPPCGRWLVTAVAPGNRAAGGERCIVNAWGDTYMSIEFREPVGVETVAVGGHGHPSIRARALRVSGRRDGVEVAAIEWFALPEDPLPIELGFREIDTLVFEAIAASGLQGGWYSLDDLVVQRGSEARSIGFEDVALGPLSEENGPAPARWSLGTGCFQRTARPDAPRNRRADTAPEGRIPGVDSRDAGPELGTTPPAPLVARSHPGPVFAPGDFGSFPPDSCGAPGVWGQGAARFLAVVNSRIFVYDDAGSVLGSTTLEAFFNVGVDLVDPRVVFDQHSQRFFVTATDLGVGIPCTSQSLYVAFNTGDPAVLSPASWTLVSFVAGSGLDAGKFADYPTLGVNAEGVYIAALMAGCVFDTMTVFAIDKPSLLAGGPTVTAFRGLPVENAIQPCVTALDGSDEYLVSRAGITQLRVRRIDWSQPGPTMTDLGFVTVPVQRLPPSAPQAGSAVPIDTVDHRLMNAVFRRGSIWTAHAVELDFDGRASVRWYEIDPVAMSTKQVGTISDPSLNYYFPTISVNEHGSVGLGFSGSDASTFVSSYFCGRVELDPPGVTSDPVVLTGGTDSYERFDVAGNNRWGDYSATVVDVEDRFVWTVQAHAIGASGGNGQWATTIAKLDLCDEARTYCRTAPNSAGNGARMGFAGRTSITWNQFFLEASGAPSCVPGQFYYGPKQVQTSLFNGFRCVGGNTFRLNPFAFTDAAGFTSFQLDFATPNAASIVTASTWNFQYLYRDVAGGGALQNLTDGLEVTFCP